jgi:hypothetical protein
MLKVQFNNTPGFLQGLAEIEFLQKVIEHWKKVPRL